MDYIDIVICHDIEFVDLDIVLNETIPTLVKLREEGKLKYIGISGLPLKIFKHMLTSCDDIDLILSYCHFNMLDTSLESVLDLCMEKNVSVINASVTGMGLLTPQGPPEWHPAPEDIKQGTQ